MKRVHLALAVADFDGSLREYSARLALLPCCIVRGTYALWRTEQLNLSISAKPDQAGQVRHLGFEDSTAEAMTEDVDTNGFVWERFTAEQQREEILRLWPDAEFLEPRSERTDPAPGFASVSRRIND
jgi:hypothetical protein